MPDEVRSFPGHVLSPDETDSHFVGSRFWQLSLPRNRVGTCALVIVSQIVRPNMIGAFGRLPPRSSEFGGCVINRNHFRPNFVSRVKAFFLEGIRVIYFEALQCKRKSRPARIARTGPHPRFLTCIVAIRLGLGFFHRELDRTTEGRLSRIEIRVDLHVGNVEGCPHFCKPMDFSIHRQLIGNFESGVV